jgi:hypothetical protein
MLRMLNGEGRGLCLAPLPRLPGTVAADPAQSRWEQRAQSLVVRQQIANRPRWVRLKAYREGQLGDIPGFVPAMIVPEQPEKGSGLGGSRIEIVSANGRRVIVDCDVDVETLLRIMRGQSPPTAGSAAAAHRPAQA